MGVGLSLVVTGLGLLLFCSGMVIFRRRFGVVFEWDHQQLWSRWTYVKPGDMRVRRLAGTLFVAGIGCVAVGTTNLITAYF